VELDPNSLKSILKLGIFKWRNCD